MSIWGASSPHLLRLGFETSRTTVHTLSAGHCGAENQCLRVSRPQYLGRLHHLTMFLTTIDDSTAGRTRIRAYLSS